MTRMASLARAPRTCALALLLLVVSHLHGAEAEDPISPEVAESLARGDMIQTTPSTDDTVPGGQVQVLPPAPTPSSSETGGADAQTPDGEVRTTPRPPTKAETPAAAPARGDGPDTIPQGKVVCVSKEVVEGKTAVHLKLRATSDCEKTQKKILSVLENLCAEDCKLEIHQEDNTDETIVSGKYVEDDVTGMTNKFNNDNIKDKTDVEEASTRWGNNSKLVLVSLLLAGLLLAALLVAGYYLKLNRQNSKGVTLAESFQVDEENQTNTLVSVAPLPQEPADKPTANGESPPENGSGPAPTTNGHSANQSQVADTEM